MFFRGGALAAWRRPMGWRIENAPLLSPSTSLVTLFLLVDTGVRILFPRSQLASCRNILQRGGISSAPLSIGSADRKRTPNCLFLHRSIPPC